MQHKYSRRHFGAMQNYYQLIQIAHLINQLTEKLKQIKNALKSSGRTILSLLEDLVTAMIKEYIAKEEVLQTVENTKQLRY